MQSDSSRRLFRRQDMVLLAAIAVIAGILLMVMLSSRSSAVTAKIYLNSEEIFSVPLHANDNYTITLEQDYGVPVSFEVKGGSIRYINVTCPDHICENTGAISMDGQMAVCMPNRVAVVLVEN